MGKPSVFDFNNDGITDQADLQTLLNNYGDVCYQPWQGPVSLSINRAGSQMMIQWLIPPSTNQLEFSSQLSGTSLWSPVGDTPFVIGASNVMFQTPSNNAMFFRVQQ